MRERTPPSDAVTLLEFSVSDPSYPFVAGSTDGATVTLRELLPRGSGRYGEFFTQTGGDPEALLSAAEAYESVEVDVLADREDAALFELVVGDVCPVVALAEAGALPRTVEAADGEGRIVAEVPAGTDACGVVDRFLSDRPSAELTRKRQQPYRTPVFTPNGLRRSSRNG